MHARALPYEHDEAQGAVTGEELGGVPVRLRRVVLESSASVPFYRSVTRWSSSSASLALGLDAMLIDVDAASRRSVSARRAEYLASGGGRRRTHDPSAPSGAFSLAASESSD